MEINVPFFSFFTSSKAISFHLKQQKQTVRLNPCDRTASTVKVIVLILSGQSYLVWTLPDSVALVLFYSHHWDYFSSSWPLPTHPHHHPLSHVSSQVPFDWWGLNEQNCSTSGSVKAVRRSTWDHCRPLTAWLAHISFKSLITFAGNQANFLKSLSNKKLSVSLLL